MAASSAPVSPNLDLRQAGGLSATLATTLPAGSYFVSVEGVGFRGPVDNYGGYASVGAYTLRQTGCVPAGPNAPV